MSSETTAVAVQYRLHSLYKKSLFHYNRVVQALLQERKGDFMANMNYDLAHIKWMCFFVLKNESIKKNIYAIPAQKPCEYSHSALQ